jgi:preprotein translocase subunit SecE
MKKIKAKKKNGMDESEKGLSEKTAGSDKAEGSAFLPKTKIKETLKKGNAKEETEEGLAAKWVGKNQWIGQVKDFFREVRIELKRVTWPSRKETIAATGMVIFLSILVAFFLGLLDVGLAKAVGIILRRA